MQVYQMSVYFVAIFLSDHVNISAPPSNVYVVGVGVGVAVLLAIIIAVAVFAARKSRTLEGANTKTTRAASVVTFEMVCGVVWGIVYIWVWYVW